MRKIDFRNGRYVVPLIVLPFLFIFNYLYLDTFQATAQPAGAGTALAADSTTFNASLPVANLEKRQVKDKFGAARDEYKYRTDYSAIRELGENTSTEQEYGSVYTEEERAMLDSLNNQVLSNQKPAGFMERVIQRQDRNRYASGGTATRRAARKQESDYEREMRLFKEQMAYVDSLSRAGDEPETVPQKPVSAARAAGPEEQESEALAVSKTANPNASYFNTIASNPREQLIKAILDEGLKVQEGGRVRVRLLDNIYIAGTELPKGTYLYGLVTGFSAQRIDITIGSVLLDEQVVPVSLSVYDNDGMKGLYVPDSQFRDFTKELAGRATQEQPLNFEQNPENSAQVLYSMADRMAQTASRAAGNAIRKNKATLKYNTVVYLIDNKAKRR
ncbi:conjugative transposon TraM protein [Pontibacter ummariensis]|uniref:Bacteroides conjugative transposon TraM protein n=1 Tax=Pontibacter ummariensis TaxID=1610492 RepID=A0A239J3P1_9BACT|nr:conjugative transposon protein TraM [Pontibacter ummariensis]PRY09053.1 conjugative transposon TraM protein [Pontibacter ummariensis]SNS99264.1 Bacteroides conjugative transposon TraM protein [Pontibacter ummariensis]